MKIFYSCLLGLVATAFFVFGQARFSADYYLADPEKYLDKKVTVLIDEVQVPAINSNSDEDFRIFSVWTRGQAQNDFPLGGVIYVMVPKADAAAFAQRHNKRTTSTPKNVSGIFRKWSSEEDKYAWASRYYIDCTK